MSAGLPKPCFFRIIKPLHSSSRKIRVALWRLRWSFVCACSKVKYSRMVTFLAMTVADIVAGSVVIEQVFAIPGLGRLLLSSISGRDYPVVQAVVVILAFWVVLVNLIADLINQRLDPRLRLS